MKLLKENEDFIYDFIKNELRFYPSSNNKFLLPFSINRPFVVYDVSQKYNIVFFDSLFLLFLTLQSYKKIFDILACYSVD